MKKKIYEVYEIVNNEYNFLHVSEDMDEAYDVAKKNKGHVTTHVQQEDGTLKVGSCNGWYLLKADTQFKTEAI